MLYEAYVACRRSLDVVNMVRCFEFLQFEYIRFKYWGFTRATSRASVVKEEILEFIHGIFFVYNCALWNGLKVAGSFECWVPQFFFSIWASIVK